MITADGFKSHCAKLTDPSISHDARRDLAAEVRDSIELVHSQEYPNFLSNYLPAFETVLRSTTSPQQIDNAVHRTRSIILEVISRLPINECLREHLHRVFALAIDILKHDNEENAVVAIHIILDYYKTFRADLATQVQPFLDFVRALYESFGNTIEALLSVNSLFVLHAASGQPQSRSRFIPLSTQSFKVVTECPLVVMFVFKLYAQFKDSNMPYLCPLMVRAIEREVPSASLPPQLRVVYQDFIASQVKTVTFLVYLLKQSPEHVKTDPMSIPRSVVKLLQSCPGGSVAIRKELLVATRFILNSPFRQGVFDQIDLLLDERVLVGTGRTATDNLRPLAYSFLTELVHSVRCDLSIEQMNKIIYMFSTNVHDPKFSHFLQTSSVRLLMNLIEGILKIHNTDPSQGEAARGLLIRILETMVTKYVTLGDLVPDLLMRIEELRATPDPISAGKRLSDLPSSDPIKEVVEFKNLLKTLTQGLRTVIWTAMNIPTAESTFARAVQGSSSQNMAGVHSFPEPAIARTQPNTPGTDRPGMPDPSAGKFYKGLTEKECELIAKLLPAGQKCFRLYSQLEKANGGSGYIVVNSGSGSAGQEEATEAGPAKHSATGSTAQSSDSSRQNSNVVCANTQEEQEIFELFGQVFTVLDIGCFQDIFGLRMNDLFEHIVENPQAIIIPQHFLANNSVSKYFADILLNFLVDSLELLDVDAFSTSEKTIQGKRASALLRLFCIMFASVNLFASNEPVLRPHVATIVRKSLKFATQADDPHAYLQLLRSFFKAINGGKHNAQFEVLYREFCPFIEPLFLGLMALYDAPNNVKHRDLIVELCLIVPARPSTIFPYLELQMKPVVWSLQHPYESRETTTHGLRALEFWIDMLQPSFLDSLLARVEPNIVSMLQDHLHSSDSGQAKYAARILGKLGPRARHYKTITKPFSVKEHSETAQHLLLAWSDGNELKMSNDQVIQLASDALMDKRLVNGKSPTWNYKLVAWKLLYSCLVPMFGICEQNETDQRVGSGLPFGIKSPDRSSEPMRERPRTSFSNQSEDHLTKTLLSSLIATCHLPELQEAFVQSEKTEVPHDSVTPADQFMGVCRYFAALTSQDLSTRQHEDKRAVPLEPDPSEGNRWRSLSPSLFVSSCVNVLSVERDDHLESGVKCFKIYLQAIVDISTGYSKKLDPYKNESMTNASPSKGSDAAKAGSGADSRNPQTQSNPIPRLTNSLPPTAPAPNTMNIDTNAAATQASATKPIPKPRWKQVATLPNMRNSDGYSRPIFPGEREIVARHVNDLIDQLSHCCFKREWNIKRGGVYGIESIYEIIPELFLRTQYHIITHFHSSRALMFVCRGALETVSKSTIERIKKLLLRILEYCYSPGDEPSAKVAVLASKYFKESVMRLGLDLMSEYPVSRDVARIALEHLPQCVDAQVSDIIRPLRDSLIRQMAQRSIRLQNIAAQIGYIECLNFFLEHGKEKFTPELFSSPFRENVLSECIVVLDSVTFDAITEAEEGFRHKPHENKFYTAKNTRLLLTLKRKIIGFLCNVAVYSNELQEPAHDRLFRSVTSCFFKCLQSGDDEVVQSSKKGLKQAIGKHPKPKELLQTNLRPILGNLADYKRLSIPYLQGLSRVLELFSHWFNLSLGDRLLEHLHRWTEPEKFAGQIKWTPGTESKIGAAILDLFHLLPPTAAKFLPKIVPMVIKLESVLPVAGPGVAHLGLKGSKAASTSPYRAPLLRYCNHHSNASATYFLEHIDDPKVRQLLVVLIRCPESVQLRKDFMDHPIRLLPLVTFNHDILIKTPFNIISLIDLLSDHDTPWLASDPEILMKLTYYWQQLCQVPDVFVQGRTTLFRIEEMKTLANIFIKYCSHFEAEVNLLFELLPVFLTRTVTDFSYVKEFLKKSVSRDGSHATKKQIITRFLDMFQDSSIPQERKVHSLQYLVIPMVRSHLQKKKELNEKSSSRGESDHQVQSVKKENPALSTGKESDVGLQRQTIPQMGVIHSGGPSFASKSETANPNPVSSGNSVMLNQQDGTSSSQAPVANGVPDSTNFAQDEVLDAILIQRIMKEILDQNDDIIRRYDEPLSAELLRLVTELIKYMPRELGSYRKELIKFGWGHLKREEPMAKHWAFVYVTTFFEAYQAPGRIVLQVYVALLRAYQSDGRELVQQALNILTPALPKRLVHNPKEHRFPIWIRYTKKILLEEGHNISNLIHILQLICRHYSFFFVARSWFVPIMSQTLTRVGLNNNSNPEGRRLCVDLISVIIKWEKYRRFGSFESTLDPPNRKRPREGDSCSDQVASKNGPEANRNVDQEPPSKTKKGNNGQPVPTASNPTNIKDSDNFQLPDGVVDTIFGFLVQVPFRAADRREAPLLLRRCLVLIEEASKLWSKCNVNMAFIEKSYAAEKQALIQQKNLTMQMAAADGKQVRPESKAELARLKRTASRPAILYTALSIITVLSKHQKERFIDKNILIIRALIKPSLIEADSQTSAQCVSLLSELLQIYPVLRTQMPQETAAGNIPGVVAPSPDVPSGNQMNRNAVPVTNAQQKSALTNAQAVYFSTNEAIVKNLCSEDPMRVYYGLVALQTITNARPQEFIRYQDIAVKAFQRLKDRFNLITAHGSVPIGSANTGSRDQPSQGNPHTSSNSGGSSSIPDHMQDPYRQLQDEDHKIDFEVQAIRLSLSLLGRNVATLESAQRKSLFQLLWSLVDRCANVPIPILLEIVEVATGWVFWTPREDQKAVGLTKDPLTPKDKINILHKLISFERIPTEGGEQVMKAFLKLILRICGGENVKERRSELVSKLEKVFLLGLKTDDPIREKFFTIFNDSIDSSLSVRINFLINRQDWEMFGDCMWIRYACETLIAAVISGRNIVSDISCARLPRLLFGVPRAEAGKMGPSRIVKDLGLQKFVFSSRSHKSSGLIEALRRLLQMDTDIAHEVWVDLFPKVWSIVSEDDRANIERGLTNLLSREFHQIQISRPQNNIKTLLEGIVQCKPLPVLRAHLMQHLGSRWNAWHTALAYFENRTAEIQELMELFPDTDDATANILNAENEDLRDAQIRMYRMLQEKDCVFAVWKVRAKTDITSRAVAFEQLGQYRQAIEIYNQGMLEKYTQRNTDIMSDGLASKEFLFWEESWINCARNLCEWDMLTEFSRTVVNHELMHECLWRVPEWSALRELLVRNPIEDGPQLKLYEAYLYMQESKMDAAEKNITVGIEKAIEKFKILPESADMDSRRSLLVNFQQFVELTESSNIFEELGALSGQATQSISIDQKVDNVRLRLNTWRERLPSIHEPLRIWSDILTWRNHMHAVIVNVLESLKEAANSKAGSQAANNTPAGGRNQGNPNLPQNQAQSAMTILQSLPQQVMLMGVNETAWNVHRFARAGRKQGFPEVALFAMNKMYPFGTMDLTEYFVKTKELSRSFLACPTGLDRSLENGLHEINRCNMEHFNPRQKAQLFTVKAKLLTEMGQVEDAAESLRVALNTSSDVGGTWLTWGKHCDKTQTSLSKNASFFRSEINVEKLSLDDPLMSNFKAELAWREATVNCYLQAVRFGSRSARPYLCRVLRLLIVDLNSRRRAEFVVNSHNGETKPENGEGTSQQPKADPTKQARVDQGVKDFVSEISSSGVSKVISAMNKDVPLWMWIPWLSQMIQMLSRTECVVIRPILISIAQQYPQAIFFYTRSFIEDRKNVDKPTKAAFKEALKTGRPLFPPLRSNAALQASLIQRQMQLARENVQRANQRCVVQKQAMQELHKKVVPLQNHPNERAPYEAQIAKLKEEFQRSHAVLEKCFQSFRILQYKYTQLTQQSQNAGDGSRNFNNTRGSGNGERGNAGNESIQQDQAQKRGNAGQAGAAPNSNQQPNGAAQEDGGEKSQGNQPTHMTPFEQADMILTHLVKAHPVVALELERLTFEVSTRLKPHRVEHLLNIISALLRKCYRISMKPGKKIDASHRTALSDVSKMCFRTGMEPDPNEQKLPPSILELRKAFEAELAPQVSKDFPEDLEIFIMRLRRWQNIFQRHVKAFPDHVKMEHISKYFVDVKDTEIEVFGQYVNTDHAEPAPDLHTKIVQFGSEIQVVHGSSHLCRGFKVIGSDGKTQEYALETAGGVGAQAAEDRVVQMYRLLNNWVFSKDAIAHQSRIHIAVPTVVPTASRTRLISIERNTATLVQGLDKFLEENGKDSDEAIVTFRNLSSDLWNRRLMDIEIESNPNVIANVCVNADVKPGSGSDGVANVPGNDRINLSPSEMGIRKELMIMTRMEAFEEMCEKHVPDSCLSRWVDSKMVSWAHRFMFTKRFAETLATTCVSSYCIGIGARRPQTMILEWNTGCVSPSNVRVLTSPNGILESDEAVPFRLTRNISRMLGVIGVEGTLSGRMANTLRTIQKESELVKMATELILRDELMPWVHAKLEMSGFGQEVRRKAAGSGGSGGAEETLRQAEYQMVEGRLGFSIEGMDKRIRGMDDDKNDGRSAMRSAGATGAVAGRDGEVAEIIRRWIERATKTENLAYMETNWQPWY